MTGVANVADLVEVRYVDRAHRYLDDTVVGRSTEVETGSLALGTRYVYWREAGAVRSASRADPPDAPPWPSR